MPILYLIIGLYLVYIKKIILTTQLPKKKEKKKKKPQFKNWAKHLKRYSSKEDIQMTNT